MTRGVVGPTAGRGGRRRRCGGGLAVARRGLWSASVVGMAVGLWGAMLAGQAERRLLLQALAAATRWDATHMQQAGGPGSTVVVALLLLGGNVLLVKLALDGVLTAWEGWRLRGAQPSPLPACGLLCANALCWSASPVFGASTLWGCALAAFGWWLTHPAGTY